MDGDVVGDNVVQQIVDEVSEVMPSPSPLEPVVNFVDDFVTQVSSTLQSDDGMVGQASDSIVGESSTFTIVDSVSTLVETVVQPLVDTQEIVQEIVETMKPETLEDTISDQVNQFVTEATQEVTTLLSTTSTTSTFNVDSIIGVGDGGGGGDEGTCKIPDIAHLPRKQLLTSDYVQWLHETRLILALSVSIVYLFTIFFIRRLLNKRSPFNLRKLLIIRSCLFTAFSFSCATILARHLLSLTKENGLGSALCSPSSLDDGTIRLWLNLFTWFKLLELTNTFYIVLRKQKLRFVHIHYHLSTLIYTFYLFGGGLIASDNSTTPAYYPSIVFINTTVQGIIYTYYIFRSQGFTPHKLITLTLNLIHLIQFTLILFILTLSLYYHLSPLSTFPSLPDSLTKLTLPVCLTSLTNLQSTCSPSLSTDIFGLIIIGTNLILFINHIRSSYGQTNKIKLL